MQRILQTAPTISPVSIDEVKLHCKIETDNTAEDEYLEGILTSAIEHVEDVEHRDSSISERLASY